MLLRRKESCLLLIDVQEKLTPFIQQSAAVIKRCDWLMRVAEDFEIPLLISEQYPGGLGATVEPLRRNHSIEKVTFSCWREPEFCEQLRLLKKKQLVLMGIEAHVCVLQTALDLLAADYEVFVVVDAVGSRAEQDYRYGLKRMKQAGAELITSEMVFFEWMERAGTDEFRKMSKTYLK